MTKVTYVFDDLTGGTIAGANVDQNFNDLTAAVDQITTANISTTAGITSTQLADRYALYAWGPWTLLPVSSGADFSSGVAQYVLPTTPVVLHKHKVLLKPGRRAYLVRAEVYCNTKTSVSHPTITITVGGTVLGSAPKNIEAAGYLTIQNSNPVDTPLLPLNNDDEIEIKVGGSAASATAAGLSVTLWIKEELVP